MAKKKIDVTPPPVPSLRDIQWHAVDRGVGWEVHAVYEGHDYNCYCDVQGCAGSVLTDGWRETMPQVWAEELSEILNAAKRRSDV